MRLFSKLFGLALLSTLVLSLAGCKAKTDVLPTVFVPADTDLVVVLDHRDKDQNKKLEEIMDLFPALPEPDKGEKEDSLVAKWEGLEEVLKGDFVAAVGVNVAEGTEAGVTVVYKGEDLEELKALATKNMDPLAMGEKDGYLIITEEQALLDAALKAYEEEKSVVLPPELIGTKSLLKVYTPADSEFGPGKASSIAVAVEEDSLRISSFGMLWEGDTATSKLNLAEMVPADGVISFSQIASLSGLIKETSTAMDALSDQPIPRSGGEVAAMTSTYKNFMDAIAGVVKLEASKVESILNAPVALYLSNQGVYYPAMTLLLETNASTLEDTKTMFANLAIYLDEVLKEFEAMSPGVLKKEVVLEKGAAIQKLSLDVNVAMQSNQDPMVQAVLAQMTDLKLELYYGVMSDGVAVIALQPNFLETYGKGDALVDSEEFKKAQVGLNIPKSVYSLGFLNLGNVEPIAAKYKSMAETSGLMTPETQESYDYFLAFMKTIKSSFSYSEVKDGSLLVEGLIKFEAISKVEKVQK